MDARDAKILQKSLTVHYDGHEYTFRLPSFRDRLEISQLSTALQQKFLPKDPNDTDVGLMMMPDFANATLFDAYATFKHLLTGTSATWVYVPGTDVKPTMDIDSWPSDAPVMEVVGEFYKELAKFRAGGSQPTQPNSSEPVPAR